MELSDLKPGQRVRVTYEGVIQDDGYCSGSEFAVKSSENLTSGYHYHRWDQAKVELVEPEYVSGAAYLDANGGVWLFENNLGYGNGRFWLSPGDGEVYDFETPVRPLVRLVREADSA